MAEEVVFEPRNKYGGRNVRVKVIRVRDQKKKHLIVLESSNGDGGPSVTDFMEMMGATSFKWPIKVGKMNIYSRGESKNNVYCRLEGADNEPVSYEEALEVMKGMRGFKQK